MVSSALKWVNSSLLLFWTGKVRSNLGISENCFVREDSGKTVPWGRTRIKKHLSIWLFSSITFSLPHLCIAYAVLWNWHSLATFHTWVQETKSFWMETDSFHVAPMLLYISSVQLLFHHLRIKSTGLGSDRYWFVCRLTTILCSVGKLNWI